VLSLVCPLCQQPLQAEGRQWRCNTGHNFDQARQGYLNLLPVQHKRSRQPGDTPGMLDCRQAFLDAGHYLPVSERINQLLQQGQPQQLLDIGCGEGWYSERLQRALPDTGMAGLDISKEAILRACRRSRQIQWLVGSSARLPVADASVDALLCVFSPWFAGECRRVLRPGGRLLLVGPHEDHLLSLRQRLYDRVNPTPDLLGELPEGFGIVSDQLLRYPLSLPATDLANLIGMTPHSFRSQPERQQALIESGLADLQVAMRLLLLQRH